MRRFAVVAVLAATSACAHSAPAALPAGGLPARAAAAAGSGLRASVVLDASSTGASVARDLVGANLETWFDESQPHVWKSFAATGIHLTRWPGGSESDTYHWQTNSVCAAGGGYAYAQAQYDNFMKTVVAPAKLDVAITVNYGSNPQCNGGGDPHEAAAWVAESKSHGYPVVAWTVGNEVFGGWEFDLHSPAHDAPTYASAVADGYYPLMKAADPNAKIGVVVAGSYSTSWDQTVLANAKYDYVELHYYPQAPGKESDQYLLFQDPANFDAAIKSVQGEIAAGANPKAPIFVGEINSVYSSPGKQSVSITEALWAAQVFGTMMNDGVALSTWWASYPGCSTGNNNSPTLYGWQNFGSYNLFSDGPPASQECSSGMAAGTPYPDGRVYALLSKFVGGGATMHPVTVSGSTQYVRAFGDSVGSGYGLLLVNLDQKAPVTVSIRLAGANGTAFAATQSTYDRAIYDLTQHDIYHGAKTTSLGSVGTTFSATLPPWSVNLIRLQ